MFLTFFSLGLSAGGNAFPRSLGALKKKYSSSDFRIKTGGISLLPFNGYSRVHFDWKFSIRLALIRMSKELRPLNAF
jgi:hypothetical protein